MADTHQDLAISPAVAASLATWHGMVERKDMTVLPGICDPDVVFRSPAVYKPYQSVMALGVILSTVMQVFENFVYHRQFASDDGLNVVLEFSALVNGKELKGIDMIRFNADGKIVEFEVMVRPMSGLQALAGEMGARLASS